MQSEGDRATVIEVNTDSLNSIHRALKQALRYLDIHLRSENIPFWLDFGTLLGSERSNDIIPWDDDIDITIMDSDFANFIQSVKKLEGIFEIFIPNRATPIGVPCKLRLLGLNGVDKELKKKGVDGLSYMGVSIDVFTVFPSRQCHSLVTRLIKFLPRINRKLNYSSQNGKSSLKSRLDRIFGLILRRLAYKLVDLVKRITFKYLSVTNSEYYRYASNSDFAHITLEKDWLDTKKLGQFGDFKYPIPSGCSKVLEQHYGEDWGILPPIAKRHSHLLEVHVSANSPFRKFFSL